MRRTYLQYGLPKMLLLGLSCLGSISSCRADPILPNLIGNHMVLQQGREIHLWGRSDPGEKITITLAGRAGSQVADAQGHWSVHLPALAAGGPFALTVTGKKRIVLKDVMIGEVWLASGQSNMAFALSGAVGAAEEIPKADYPQIRLFTVPKKIALSLRDDTLPATWQICSPDTVKGFSAVAYFFARELHKSLNIPIGVIQSTWPGTTIEEWIDPRFLRNDAELKPVFAEWDASSPEVKTFAESSLDLDLEFDDFELMRETSASVASPTSLSNFDDGTSQNALGGNWSYDWEGAPDTVFELVSPGYGNAGLAARVAGQLDGTQTSSLTTKYKLDGAAVDLSAYVGIRFWVRGTGSFRFRSLQPTITDYDDYATGVLKASADWRQITIFFRDLRQEGWGVTQEFTPQALSGFSIESLTTLGYAPLPISALYEGMITPVMPYQLRGAIWYQGESNALRAYQYRKLLPALIKSWRAASHRDDLEFLIVQLPNHGAVPEQPTESAWAELREAQFLTMKQLPHTGMAVTIDLGEPKNVHPPRKVEVGQRLALWALGKVYAKPIVYSGPMFESMRIMKTEIEVRFKNVGSGLQARDGAPVTGFAIAGPDRKFYWADASLQRDTVTVSSPQVPNPVAVRYGWADSPECNLFNKDGLPASPFRTDDWPGITRGKN